MFAFWNSFSIAKIAFIHKRTSFWIYFLNEIAIFRFSNYHFVISKYLFPHISPVSTCFANIILSAIAPVLMKQRQSAINRSYTLFIYSIWATSSALYGIVWGVFKVWLLNSFHLLNKTFIESIVWLDFSFDFFIGSTINWAAIIVSHERM